MEHTYIYILIYLPEKRHDLSDFYRSMKETAAEREGRWHVSPLLSAFIQETDLAFYYISYFYYNTQYNVVFYQLNHKEEEERVVMSL